MNAMGDIDQLDVNQLRQLARQQHQHLQQHAQVVADQTQSLEQKESELKQQVIRIEHLEALLRRMNQQRFGSSSEKHPGQAELHLFNEAELIALAGLIEDQPDDDAVAVPGYQRKTARSRQLPQDLPRVEKIYELNETQRQCDCGEVLQPMGHETSEQLAIIPQQYYVIVHKQCKYSCRCGVTTAPKPKAPLPGSQASPQLIAHIMSAKYHDGLPLYRQEKMAKREGLDLPRSKLARWVIEGSKVLQPLWNLLEDTL